MNWEALSAIGQLLSALGVVVTLAYLARQIRVSNDAAADANRLQRAAGVREMQLALSTNEALRATWQKALGDRPATDAIARRLGLTRDEADQLTALRSTGNGCTGVNGRRRTRPKISPNSLT